MKKIIALCSILFLILIISPKTKAAGNQTLGQVVTNGSNLNLREKATTSSNIKLKLKNKSYVIVLDDVGDFYYVNVNGTYGYAHEDYIKIISDKLVKTTANLNIRSSASTSSSILTVASKGSELFLLEKGSSWSLVYTGEVLGYASNKYLTSDRNILDVISFKQYDTRWASLEIVPGKTMRKIGCLTTAFAMSESYRLGYTITPENMMKRLKYTSSGDAYWPSNYVTSTSSNYLTTIYNNLKAGKPSIVGATSYSMHFIVVTGFKGGSVSPENFLINDPGSSSRTTLADFFKAYPNFYKLAYYK